MGAIGPGSPVFARKIVRVLHRGKSATLVIQILHRLAERVVGLGRKAGCRVFSARQLQAVIIAR